MNFPEATESPFRLTPRPMDNATLHKEKVYRSLGEWYNKFYTGATITLGTCSHLRFIEAEIQVGGRQRR